MSQANWLADRIAEIERFTGGIPSIAVLVKAESEIFGLADALGAALATNNVTIQACPQGQVEGNDSAVRYSVLNTSTALSLRPYSL